MISSVDIPTRMPGGIRRSKLFGPNGKPVSYFLYPSPRWNLKSYRPRYWLSADTKTNVSEYDRWELVNYSRQLFAQIGNLSTAIGHKNSWAFGDAWEPHYAGTNPKWGQEASEFLRMQFYPFCNLRGPQYDLARSLQISGQLWDVDGDDAMILTETESGFPALAFFPSTRIGTQATGTRGSMDRTKSQVGGSSGIVNGGPFDGAKIFDGVILDRNSRMIGLRIIAEDGTVSDVPSFNCDLSYEPDWHDQGRGIPRTAVCLLRWMNRQDIDEFLQRGMKRAASIGLKFKRQGGEAGLGNEVITSEVDTQIDGAGDQAIQEAGSTPPKVYYEELEGGEMYYLDSDGREEIEPLNYQNPHPNSEAFIERIERECLGNLGWPYEMINVGKTGRAPTRLVCDLANQSIWARQRTGYRRWKRIITYAVAKAMKSGYLSKNNDGLDPYLWEPGFPKVVSVDQGNDAAADREAFKLGLTSRQILMQKVGFHWQDVSHQREVELRQLVETATQLSKDYPQLRFEQAMELLEQRNPNPQILGGQGPGSAPGPSSPQRAEDANVHIDNMRIERGKSPRRRVVVKRDSVTGQILGAEIIDE